MKAPYKKPLSSEALDSTPAHTLKGRGRECVNTLCPRGGHILRDYGNRKFQRPVEVAASTGQLAFLEIHKTNRHHRKDSGHQGGQHIPEEVHHGSNLLSEDMPTAALYAYEGMGGKCLPGVVLPTVCRRLENSPSLGQGVRPPSASEMGTSSVM